MINVMVSDYQSYPITIGSKKSLIEQQLAEAAREDDEEEEVVEEQLMEADASSDEDVGDTSGCYSTQLSVEASIISMDTSTSSSTMYTSLDDAEVCLSVCVFGVYQYVHQYTTLAKFLTARACRSTRLASYFYW